MNVANVDGQCPIKMGVRLRDAENINIVHICLKKVKKIEIPGKKKHANQ